MAEANQRSQFLLREIHHRVKNNPQTGNQQTGNQTRNRDQRGNRDRAGQRGDQDR